jgi:hypothetical protein
MNPRPVLVVRAGAVLLALALGVAVPALPQAAAAPAGAGSSASISVTTPEGKDRYDFTPRETCVLTAFGEKPLGLSVVLTSEKASLSLDMPNIDEKHASEIQVVLVVAGTKAGARTASITYEIDTRPDDALEPFQKAERARKGMSGKATTTLMQQGANAMLTFSGETATGVKISGEVTCRKVVNE